MKVFNNKYNTDQDILKLLKIYGIETTNNAENSIFLLKDGTMIDGSIINGYRTLNHNEVISILSDYFNTDHNLLHELGMILVVPENRSLLIYNSHISKLQKQFIDTYYKNFEIKYLDKSFKVPYKEK